MPTTPSRARILSRRSSAISKKLKSVSFPCGKETLFSVLIADTEHGDAGLAAIGAGIQHQRLDSGENRVGIIRRHLLHPDDRIAVHCAVRRGKGHRIPCGKVGKRPEMGSIIMPGNDQSPFLRAALLAAGRPRQLRFAPRRQYRQLQRQRRHGEHGEELLRLRFLRRLRTEPDAMRGSIAAVVRVIRFGLPTAEEAHIPPEVMRAAQMKKGIVLVTGSAGSGKSTTLACIINEINRTRTGHILTLEDPVEYIHRHDKCIVSQREIGCDCPSYVAALRSALRESPDVILLGEMRDKETMEVAMTAAETGQLLLSSLHTTGAANTIDRIIDAFPPNQQAQIRLQLSMVLQAVISQQLVPGVDGTPIPVFEIMYSTLAIRNMIRESKTHQLDAAIASGAAQGMRTMDMALAELVRQKRITEETALYYCTNYETMQKRLQLL